MRSRMVSSVLSVLPTSQVFTSGYVNTETILHFFYEITNERRTKTVFTYAHVKWFYGQSECAYYLNYFINEFNVLFHLFSCLLHLCTCSLALIDTRILILPHNKYLEGFTAMWSSQFSWFGCWIPICLKKSTTKVF